MAESTPIEGEPTKSTDISDTRAAPLDLNDWDLNGNKLRPREQIFIRAYADPTSPTFNNARRSMLAASPHLAIDSASAKATEILHKPQVRSAIHTILDRHNLGTDTRVSILKEIASTDSIDTTQLDKDGNTVSITRSSNVRNKLKAIDIANKLDGSYARAGEIAKAEGKTLEPIIAHYTRLLRESIAKGSTIAEEGQGEAVKVDSVDSSLPIDGEPTESMEAMVSDAVDSESVSTDSGECLQKDTTSSDT